MMFDLGIQEGTGNFDDDEYTVLYLSDLEPGVEITGDLYISDLRAEEYNGKSIQKFYLIVIDHLKEVKWVCSINTSVYENNSVVTVYGARGGRVYGIIDSLAHCLNGTELNQKKSYTVVFEVFKENINEQLGLVTVRAVKSSNINAKTPNLQFIKAMALNKNIKIDLKVKKSKEESNLYSVDDQEARNVIEEISQSLREENKPVHKSNILRECLRFKREGEISKELMSRIKEQLK